MKKAEIIENKQQALTVLKKQQKKKIINKRKF